MITPKPVSTDKWDDISRWYTDPMMFYFQQYKFALYCATKLCGVSKDQLTQGLDLTRAIFNFHVMYQTKKILYQMQARNPGDPDFNPLNNPYNKTEYEKLKNEFSVTTIPEIDQPANGLGYIIVNGGKLEDQYLEYIHKLPNFPSTGKLNKYLNIKPKGSPEHNSYAEWGPYYDFHKADGVAMDRVQQDSFNYLRVIPDHFQTLTLAGIVRLNDSIRSYVYCLLGSQVQARAAAEGNNSLEAQQQFLVLVNDLKNKKQSLEESVKNFEDALSKTQGRINYVIAKALYMIPSDLNLNKLGKSVDGFNDKVVVAKDFNGLGVTKSIVTHANPPPPPKPKVTPKVTPNTLTSGRQEVTPKVTTPVTVIKPKVETPNVVTPNTLTSETPVYTSNPVDRKKRDTHEGNKILIGGSIITAGIVYALMR